MDFNRLADLLFPNVTKTPEEVEASFPRRNLPEGAKVTRLAPSPTGFIHFGTLFPALVNERLAHQSEGIFYLRVEDTDSKREVEGAEEDLINTLAYYRIEFDEGAIAGGDNGVYGPYRQSYRADIYHVFAKQLVREGKAYPCFSSEEELEALKVTDKKAEIQNKDWHADESAQRAERQAVQRAITIEDVEAHLKAGDPFVLRILALGDPEKKTPFTDLIKGSLQIPENDEDFVLLKSDGIPTYHFAHAVDDHLMGTTHVIRGEEWLPSLAKHIQLFRYLNFRMPKYMHLAQLMKLEGNSKKKLSKRDKGAALADYKAEGYPPESVIEYVMTLLNSNYEEWRRANPDADWKSFPFSIKKMNTSGALFDLDKFTDVSKTTISRMDAEKAYAGISEWAKSYDSEFSALLARDPEYAKRILAIGRGGKKPRKDLAKWNEAKDYMSFFYDELFTVVDSYPENFDASDIKAALSEYIASYDPTLDNSGWFENVKAISEKLGFSSDVKAYKANPEAFKGHVGDISGFLRIAITGRQNSPDLYEITQILGYDRTIERVKAAIDML